MISLYACDVSSIIWFHYVCSIYKGIKSVSVESGLYPHSNSPFTSFFTKKVKDFE